MKGVIPTPDIAKIFHPTPDIQAKKMPDTDTQNSPRHSTPTFQKTEKCKKLFPSFFRAFGAISYLK